MKNIHVVIGVGALIVMAYKFKPAFGVRGIRNHNAGNIRSTTSDTWEGQTGNDGDFAIFESAEFGVRALARLLMNYNRIHGLNTVSELISRWAPSNENDTGSYIDSVADSIGKFSWWPLDLSDQDIITDLVKAIIKHENGIQPYSDDIIKRGVQMAGESFA